MTNKALNNPNSQSHLRNVNILYLPFSFPVLVFVIAAIFLQLPNQIESTYSSEFIWSAVNKTLDEDRLSIVDGNNDKVKVKSCTKVVLFNKGSEQYLQGNYSGEAIFINTSISAFTTEEVLKETREKMSAVNLGICLPCIAMISIVNVSSTPEEKEYRRSSAEQQLKQSLGAAYWEGEETKYQNYKLLLSQQLTQLLQFKTPIQSRYLILVRLVEKTEDLNKCHGKKYTKYPRRLVPIWEQVLFDYFKEARVLQGSIEKDSDEHTLLSVKENAAWVWMCEEINRRLDLEDSCYKKKIISDKETCQQWETEGNFSTATIDITNKGQCGTYRPRT